MVKRSLDLESGALGSNPICHMLKDLQQVPNLSGLAFLQINEVWVSFLQVPVTLEFYYSVVLVSNKGREVGEEGGTAIATIYRSHFG